MKKIAVFVLALVLVFAFSACGNSAKATQLGDSDFSVVLPEGFEIEEDKFDEDQIAFYYKDKSSIDFDVYLWEKGDQYELVSEAEYFASEYGAVPEAVTVNGIEGMKYVTEEEFNGYVYTVVNYMFEDDTYIVELSFWTIDTAEEYAAVDEIINTLKKN